MAEGRNDAEGKEYGFDPVRGGTNDWVADSMDWMTGKVVAIYQSLLFLLSSLSPLPPSKMFDPPLLFLNHHLYEVQSLDLARHASMVDLTCEVL
jgi:hypothetical protein